jgi:hypothetical protein
MVAITFFPDYAAKTKSEKRLSAAALAELIDTTVASTKDQLPWLKLARFGDVPKPKSRKGSRRWSSGSLRWNGNVDANTGVEGDYDGEKVAIARAVEVLREAGIAAIVYASPSWREDTPRWRVLCEYSAELPPTERDHMMGRLEGGPIQIAEGQKDGQPRHPERRQGERHTGDRGAGAARCPRFLAAQKGAVFGAKGAVFGAKGARLFCAPY